MPFFLHPRADKAQVAGFRQALRRRGRGGRLGAAAVPVVGPGRGRAPGRGALLEAGDRDHRRTSASKVMNSEFNGRPEAARPARRSSGARWRSCCRCSSGKASGWCSSPIRTTSCEDGRARIDLVRGIDWHFVSFLYCAPHTFHQGGDIEGIMRYAGPLLTHVHIADSFDHRASSGLRYIVNPPGSPARIHQHLDIGQGEVDWDVFFAHAGRGRVRRHRHRLRLRLGGTGPRVLDVQPGADPAVSGEEHGARVTCQIKTSRATAADGVGHRALQGAHKRTASTRTGRCSRSGG